MQDGREYGEILDVGNPKQVRKKKSAAKLERERCDLELEALVDLPGGAYFLWRLLSQCGMYSASEDDGLALHEGKRRVGLWVLAELMGVNEELYTKVRMIGSEREKGS